MKLKLAFKITLNTYLYRIPLLSPGAHSSYIQAPPELSSAMIEELKNDKGSWLQLLKFDSAHSNHVDSCATETATEAQSTSEMEGKDKHVNDWMKGASDATKPSYTLDVKKWTAALWHHQTPFKEVLYNI